MSRTDLERRPLLILCLALILGLTLPRHSLNLIFLLPAPFVLLGLRTRTLAVVGAVLGVLLGPGQPPKPLLDQRFVSSVFTVASLPKITPYGQRCEVESEAARLMFTYAGPMKLCPGSKLSIIGLAGPPVAGMDAYYASRALVGRLDADPESVRVVSDGPWVQRVGCAWRDSFLAFLNKELSPEAGAATAALTLNADGLLDPGTRDEMQRTGTTHIIAASGLQVIVIAGALLWLLMWLPIPRSLQLAAIAMILGAYCVATGLHPPVVRAALMFLIANCAYLVHREPDWPSALAASSLIYLLWKPGTVYEMGFQFSVIAVLFLHLFSRHEPWRKGLSQWLTRSAKRGVRTAVVAGVTVAPLIAYHFGLVSLISIPANLLVVLAVAPVVICSMAALPLSLIWAPLGGIVKVAEPCTSYIRWVLDTFGGQGAAISVPDFSAYWLVPFYLLLLMLARPYVRKP